MSCENKQPETVADLIAKIECKAKDGDYIFRGETKSSYKDDEKDENEKPRTEVSSRLWRDYKFREEVGDFDIERVQREMLVGAKKHRGRPAQSSEASHALRTAQRLIWQEPSVQSSGAFNTEDPEDFEILTEIQHYGGKTNLIDFTTDYRIALFFACDGDYAEEGRVVLQKNDSKGKIQTPWNPRHRVIAQKSVFVRPRKGYIDPDEKDIVKIPSGLKKSMLDYLKKYHGIDKEMIYNDLHGFIYNQDRHGEYHTRFYRGYAYNNEGEYDKAIEHYNAAIKLNPRSSAVYNNIGIIYRKKGNLDKAIRNLDKAIELNQNDAVAYSNRGLAYTQKGDLDAAIEDCTKAIELDPKYVGGYNNRGLAYIQKGDLDAAIEDFTKAIELDPNSDKGYYNRATAYHKIGEHEKARQDDEKADELERKSGQ